MSGLLSLISQGWHGDHSIGIMTLVKKKTCLIYQVWNLSFISPRFNIKVVILSLYVYLISSSLLYGPLVFMIFSTYFKLPYSMILITLGFDCSSWALLSLLSFHLFLIKILVWENNHIKPTWYYPYWNQVYYVRTHHLVLLSGNKY